MTKLSHLLKKNHMTAYALGKKVGIDPNAARRIELGHMPSLVSAIKVSRYFKCTVEDLFGHLVQ